MTRQDAVAVAGLLTLGVLAYGSVVGFAFVSWDDPSYVTENGKVLRGLTGDNLLWAFTTLFFANWHPLTWLSHMAVVQIAGTDPAAHHAVNLLLHLGNAVLCYVFFASSTGDRPRAFLVAALFAVHPLHAETVAWVSDRKMLLAVFFMWLALLAYRTYVRQPGWGRYLLVLTCAALAMLSKPAAVVLAGLLLLVDVWPLHRGLTGVVTVRRLLLEKAPILAMGAALGGLTLLAQQRGGALVSTGDLSFGERGLNAVLTWGRYVGAAFWPGDRQFFYSLPEPWPWAATSLSGLALAASAALAWRMRSSRPAVLVGWLWGLLVLLPTLGLIKVGSHAMADRYVYFASVGLFAGMVWGVPVPRPGWGRTVLLGSVVLALVALTIQAGRTAGAWRDSETLYRTALRQDPAHAVAHGLLAEVMAERGELSEAAEHAQKALARPLSGNLGMLAETVLGRAALNDGAVDRASEHFLRARTLNPDFHEPLYWLGEAALASADFASAQAWLMQALRLRPVYPEVFDALARMAWLRDDPAGAQRYWQTAVASDRRQVPARVGLAVLHAQHGDQAGWQRWMSEARDMDRRRAEQADQALRRAWALRSAAGGG